MLAPTSRLANIRPKRLPRLFLLLTAAVVTFVLLTPFSLQTFGPPPGSRVVKNWLGYDQAPGPLRSALAQSPAESLSNSKKKKPNVVIDLQRFKPKPAAVVDQQEEAQAKPAGAQRPSKATAPTCPDPFKAPAHPLQDPSKTFDATLCQDLEASSPDFKVSACPPVQPASATATPVPCNAFFLVVERTDVGTCEAAYNEPISSYKKDADALKRETGPDTFQVLISGSERYSVSRHVGYDNLNAPCRYVYPVQLSNAGPFTLQVLHVYDLWHGHADYMATKPGSQQYFGAKDTVDAEGLHTPPVPRIVQTTLFPDSPEGISSTVLPSIIQCPDTCQTYKFKANPDNSATGSVRVLSDLSARYNALPLCSQQEPITGAYFPDPTPVQNTSLPIVPFRWHPLGCRLLSQNVKMLDGEKGLAARKQCLGQSVRQVVFQGDSHTRMSYDGLVPRLRDLGDEQAVYGKAKVKENTVHKTDFTFVWDSHFIRMLREPTPPRDADVLVLSLGAHQARNRWLTRTFGRLIDRITTHMLKWTTRMPRVLFITVPAKQLYNGDWRTHPRVQSWSDLTMDKFREAGLSDVGFVEGFSSTLPFTPESPDGIHFRDLPAQEAWLMQLMHKMDLCDEGSS